MRSMSMEQVLPVYHNTCSLLYIIRSYPPLSVAKERRLLRRSPVTKVIIDKYTEDIAVESKRI